MGDLDEVKRVARVHYDEAASTDAAMAAVSPDVTYHGPAGLPPTLQSWRDRHVRLVEEAFSDIETVVNMQIAEGDLVVTQWTMTATHIGDFLGVPATGKRLTMTGLGIDRVVDGRVVEHWGLQDLMGVAAQIGGTPTPEPPRIA